jgi:hypothetical protein
MCGAWGPGELAALLLLPLLLLWVLYQHCFMAYVVHGDLVSLRRCCCCCCGCCASVDS